MSASITGTTEVGQTLTASTQGQVTGWLRCDEAGQNCGEIAGAEGTTYTVKPEDQGATLRVQLGQQVAGGMAHGDNAEDNSSTWARTFEFWAAWANRHRRP